MQAFKNTIPVANIHLHVDLNVMCLVPACMCSIAQFYSIVGLGNFGYDEPISLLADSSFNSK